MTSTLIELLHNLTIQQCFK